MVAARVAALVDRTDAVKTVFSGHGAADPDELLSHFIYGQFVAENAVLHRVIEHQLDGFVLHVRRRMTGLAAGVAELAAVTAVVRRWIVYSAERFQTAALFFGGHVIILPVNLLTPIRAICNTT